MHLDRRGAYATRTRRNDSGLAVSAGGVSALNLAGIEARLTAWRALRAPHNAGKEFLGTEQEDIAALVEHVKALRAALEPFAQEGKYIAAARPDAQQAFLSSSIVVGELRRAAAVLGAPQ